MKKVLMRIMLVMIPFASSATYGAVVEDSNSLAVKKPLIQMAILLDTSSSMSGLIDQARTELWSIVNEFILAKKNGTAPEFQLSLYEYGKDSLSQKEGYLRMIVPFTTDLDKVSEELFALKTNGGEEYCGWVIQQATEKLSWSNSPEDLKVIFIAGNEPFTQGPVDYKQACQEAISKGIIVNTIHCGSESEGTDGKWKDGAVLADGRFLNIDQNRQAVNIPAPQDKEISVLSMKINSTYVPYGVRGKMSYERQSQQDKNAEKASVGSVSQRALSKSSQYYKNESWDLVDAVKNGTADIRSMEEKELPENMRKMSLDERMAYIEKQTKEREEIQKTIQKLNNERSKFIAEEAKKKGNETNTLGSAVVQVITEQAKKKSFVFEATGKTEPKSNPK